MATLRIHQPKQYAGDYQLDLDDEPLTTLEWRWVKKISGYLPATIGEGVRGGDPDVNVALATIALVRAGRVVEGDALGCADRLARVAVDAFEELDDPSEEVGEDPTTLRATESPPQNGGRSGSLTLDRQASDRAATGRPDSPRSATSDRLTSLG
jgi:hypothetical protein